MEVMGWKSVAPDLTSWRDRTTQWLPGSILEAHNIDKHNNGPCPVQPGDGFSIALNFRGAAQAEGPTITVVRVAYDEADILGLESDKVRVRKARVLDILDVSKMIRDGKFTGASLYGASLDGANLNGASLDGANLDGASLDGANLNGANLDGASLNGASLDGANLDGANLDGASLYGANLDGASLNGANLDGASLNGASLDGANLDGASLDGATRSVYDVAVPGWKLSSSGLLERES